MERENVIRKVFQFHFTSWPDHGVPLYSQSLIPLLMRMIALPQDKSPIVVHCSAGVGRTGTIILADICLRMAAAERAVDVLKYLALIREQRVNMVDNSEQYKLVHLVLLDCLFKQSTSILCDEQFSKNIRDVLSNKIEEQMNDLDDTVWRDQVMRCIITDETNPNFPDKNRFQHVVPGIKAFIFIFHFFL